jgi:16S rRNA (guanine527-N7)-methyltransferase
MANKLPALSVREFSSRLVAALQADLTPEIGERLWAHYEELRRWSSGLALIGRGTAESAVERHYAESLAAVPLVGRSSRLVDLGSGAGFPGWVLAAARPDLDVVLVEARHRKALFLEAASRRASLSCSVLNARVGSSLPEDFPISVDLLTVRALRLQAAEWSALSSRLSEDGRILRWVGPSAPDPPDGFAVGRRVLLRGSQRAVEELVRRGVEELKR